MRKLNVVHLYPKEMNIYGDNGNILIIKKRLEWRGINYNLHSVGIGDSIPTETDLIIGGGGQDSGQQEIAKDLQSKKERLIQLAKIQKIPMLMICGMYQMFGHYFQILTGEKIPGIGIIDLYTKASTTRIIGNITCESQWGTLIGYENHSGLTYLLNDTRPLAIAKFKQGNNGFDKTEGAIMNNVFGTYMHGPILAKAPFFTDMLINKALKNNGQLIELPSLDDRLEELAARSAQKRPR